MNKNWKPDSWRSKTAKHLPIYSDEKKLKFITDKLNTYPPLVFAGESRSLLKQLGDVANGNAFLLQGGDCAESFADFNANKFQVLIITRAGGEGIDLKGVRNMIILDPVWHDAGLQQVIGRVVRYKSHVHLPPNQRNVTIWKLVLVPPSNKKPAITSKLKNYTNPTGDLLLYKIIKRKSDEQKQVDKILKACEI